MANPGESPEPAAPAASGGADAADAGAATLDDMAALMAEGATEDGEAAPAPDAAKPDGEGEKPADEAKPDDEKPDESKPKEPEPDEKAEAKTPEALRAGFAALARDRKKLRDREARADAKVQAAQQYEQKAQGFDTLVKRLHEDPIGLLREAGGDELINKALDGVIASEKSPAEREVEKLRRDLDAEKQRIAQEKEQQLVTNWRNGIVNEVRAKADAYDLVTSLGMEEAVIETITQYHMKHNGAVLPVATAAAHVEKALEAALSKSKKFGARGAVKPAVTATPSQKTGGTTLSSVASGDAPNHSAELPDDDDARFNAVLRDMAANGQL